MFASFVVHFRIFFAEFSCFFEDRSQRAFLEGKCADLCSKVRFWSDFGLLRGPKIDPWGAILAQKGEKTRGPSSGTQGTGGVRDAIQHPKRSWDRLFSILVRF